MSGETVFILLFVVPVSACVWAMSAHFVAYVLRESFGVDVQKWFRKS